MLVIGNPEGFAEKLADAIVEPLVLVEIYKAQLKQLQAENKRLQHLAEAMQNNNERLFAENKWLKEEVAYIKQEIEGGRLYHQCSKCNGLGTTSGMYKCNICGGKGFRVLQALNK